MDRALILIRFLHFGAAMLLWGGAVFGGARSVPPRAGRLWLLLALTAIGWLMLEAGVAGDGWTDTLDPGTIWALLSATAVGQAWAFHMALVAALGVAIWRGRGVTLAAGVALASLALVGHAAMQQGWIGGAHRANAALHLLAAGYWVGALPPLLGCLARMRQGEATLGPVVMRYSRLGHWAVAAVIVTGVANTALVLGRVPGLGSPYQALLVLKIALVAAMVGVALVNRYGFVPRLKAANDPAALRAIARGTLAEIALGAAVLALVSAFATFDPV
ncbi:MAG: copper homeostasis membrane protein CopD [Rhodobacteraceae bacterium]|nr:copper homeostasis membrane protein CopD [Paracoccaceae bacterium]